MQAVRATSQPLEAAEFAQHAKITEAAAKKWGVPFWLLWGTAGAESTWGTNGSNIFGLKAAAGNAQVGNWQSAADQAAKTYAGLIKQYGSIEAAVPHYSGNSYTLQHIQQLDAEFALHHNAGGLSGALKEAEEAPQRIPENIKGTAEEAVPGLAGLISLLTNTETWVRLAEVIAGAVLIFMALKALSGGGAVSIKVPGPKAGLGPIPA